MNLFTKKEELIELINSYLNDNASCRELQEFAWEIIDNFSSKDTSELPTQQPFEREFWFSIWQITHLADEEHEQDGLTKKELTKALSYLKNESKLPNNYFGERP